MAPLSRRDFLRSSALFGAAALALPACGGTSGIFSSTTTVPANRFAPPSAPRRQTSPYQFGLHVDEVNFARNLHQREADTGRGVDVVLTFAKVTDPIRNDIRLLMEAGYDVCLTLEYWSSSDAPADPSYSLKSITAGAHDDAAAKWFEFFKTLPRAIYLRTLHEGNGDWYPWGVVTPTNTVEDYIPAFRHVIDQARAIAGVDKIRPQFCLNRQAGQDRDIRAVSLYPGHEYVDSVVVNAYNRPENPSSRSFSDLVSRYYGQLKTIAPDKPMWIGEISCTEAFGDKPQWIIDMFASIKTTYPVANLTWFDEVLRPENQPVRDWNMDSSPESLAAFKAGINAA